MSDKFTSEALERAWRNFQKNHKDLAGRVNDDLRQKAFSMARTMYQAIGKGFSSASGSLNKQQKALVVRQAIDGVIMANNDICEWRPGRDAVYALAEFVCRSVMAQNRKRSQGEREISQDPEPPKYVRELWSRLEELGINHDLVEAA